MQSRDLRIRSAARTHKITALLGTIGLLSLGACGVEGARHNSEAWLENGESEASMLPDADKFTGLNEFRAQLASSQVFAGSCAFDPNSGTVTLTVNPNDTVTVAKATNGNITVNGAGCSGASATNTKILNIVEGGGTGPETVLLDYLNGVFAPGTRTAGQGTFCNFGTDGNDKLMIRGTSVADTFAFGASGINVNGDSNVDITLTASPSLFTVSMGPGADSFTAAGDAVTGAVFTAGVTVYGGADNDSLRGGNGNDVLNGDDGVDMLTADANSTSADGYYGGAGIDTLSYALRGGNLTITMGDGTNDGELNERDFVSDDIEVLLGGNGDDTLSGSLNPNIIVTLNGGNGNDFFLQRNAGTADSRDTLVGGAGVDTVDYSVRTIGVNATMDGQYANDGGNGELDSIAADIENVKAGTGNDMLTGNASNNVIAGGAGINVLNGGDGDDTFDQGLNAANGNDTIDGGAGVDMVDYSARTNAITLALDGNTLSGDVANGEGDVVKITVENANGGTAADTITGNSSINNLYGNGGNDTISALDNDDVLDGGAGTDTLNCGMGSDIAVNGETLNSCELTFP